MEPTLQPHDGADPQPSVEPTRPDDAVAAGRTAPCRVMGWTPLLLAVAGGLAVATWHGTAASGPKKTEASLPTQVEGRPTPRYFSSSTCATEVCHYRSEPFD